MVEEEEEEEEEEAEYQAEIQMQVHGGAGTRLAPVEPGGEGEEEMGGPTSPTKAGVEGTWVETKCTRCQTASRAPSRARRHHCNSNNHSPAISSLSSSHSTLWTRGLCKEAGGDSLPPKPRIRTKAQAGPRGPSPVAPVEAEKEELVEAEKEEEEEEEEEELVEEREAAVEGRSRVAGRSHRRSPSAGRMRLTTARQRGEIRPITITSRLTCGIRTVHLRANRHRRHMARCLAQLRSSSSNNNINSSNNNSSNRSRDLQYNSSPLDKLQHRAGIGT